MKHMPLQVYSLRGYVQREYPIYNRPVDPRPWRTFWSMKEVDKKLLNEERRPLVVQIQVERGRMHKLDKKLAKLNTRLSNATFSDRTPATIVALMRATVEQLAAERETVAERLRVLEGCRPRA